MSPKLELRSQMMTSSCTILKKSYISECANLAVADLVGWEGLGRLSIWGNIIRQVTILSLSNCIYQFNYQPLQLGCWVAGGVYMGHFPQDGENEQNLSEFFF